MPAPAVFAAIAGLCHAAPRSAWLRARNAGGRPYCYRSNNVHRIDPVVSKTVYESGLKFAGMHCTARCKSHGIADMSPRRFDPLDNGKLGLNARLRNHGVSRQNRWTSARQRRSHERQGFRKPRSPCAFRTARAPRRRVPAAGLSPRRPFPAEGRPGRPHSAAPGRGRKPAKTFVDRILRAPTWGTVQAAKGRYKGVMRQTCISFGRSALAIAGAVGSLTLGGAATSRGEGLSPGVTVQTRFDQEQTGVPPPPGQWTQSITRKYYSSAPGR